jgi:uracil-DNA glycosylase family 4
MSDSLEALNSELLDCRKCPRLVAWREEVARTKRRAYRDWEYWGRPVPGFGDPRARVLVVGLAPGAHGSNRTGRQFTGDGSGDFLYPALYRAGFASQPGSQMRDDGLTLRDMYIAPVCRCAPPANKPLPAEIANCQPYLERELALLQPQVIVVLGRIAFDSLLRILQLRNRAAQTAPLFTHGGVYPLVFQTGRLPAAYAGAWLVCSYHPSQQNTLTGKLTIPMFDSIWQEVNRLLAAGPPRVAEGAPE